MYWLRPRVLTRHFYGPAKFSESGWRWWLTDESALQAVLLLDRYLWKNEGEGITPMTEKALKCRRTYRLAPPEEAGSAPYFAKQMALPARKRLGALLGSDSPLLGSSHGTAELAYNLTVDGRTQHGVRTFAFGEYCRYGLPVQQVLLQEYLTDWHPFGAVWPRSGDAASRQALLGKLGDMLLAFREAGIHHLDLHPGNVMVSPDPQAPLRAIDCGKMSAQADPALAAALHLGVFFHELNNASGTAASRAQVSLEHVQGLLQRIAGNESGYSVARQLLPLLLRHSTKRPFARRRLVEQRPPALDLRSLEKHLQKLSRPARPAGSVQSPALALGAGLSSGKGVVPE